MATAIFSRGVVRWCSSTAVPLVHRCSGLVDVAPEFFWDCTGECATLYTISTDLIVSTHTGESLKCGELQADITTHPISMVSIHCMVGCLWTVEYVYPSPTYRN